MSTSDLPLIVEPEVLQEAMENHTLLVVDLCSEQQFYQGHLPRAVHVSPAELVTGVPPAPGKLPPEERLKQLFSRLGLTPDTHVVVYDDEGGGWAGRFIWTLDVIGHQHYSYLNGGIWAWRDAGLPLTDDLFEPQPVDYPLTINPAPLMEKQQILQQLDEPNFLVWDARSREEFFGERQTAQRNGHIPGAVHGDWLELMDRNASLRIRKDAKDYLQQKGITADKQIVTHCHTHHRSGLTYLVGKSLGLDIKAYPGSWSEWGNADDTPVATGEERL